VGYQGYNAPIEKCPGCHRKRKKTAWASKELTRESLYTLIKNYENKGHAAFAAMLYLTGSRVSEIIYDKKGYKITKANIQIETIDNKQFLVIHGIRTLKRRADKDIILERTDLSSFKHDADFIEIILDYIKDKQDDARLFGYSRTRACRIIKRMLGQEYSPHYLRHLRFTHLAKMGWNATQLKTKVNLASSMIPDKYTHLNYRDLARLYDE
jgi:integrase